MTELQDLCTDLQAIWYQQIPLSKAMDMRIVDFADNTLTCCASLAHLTLMYMAPLSPAVYMPFRL